MSFYVHLNRSLFYMTFQLHFCATVWKAQSLPEDLFDSMHPLTYIHMAGHGQLRTLPSFLGLTNLKALVLATLPSLQELPSFQPVERLERLELMTDIASDVSTIADLVPLTMLVHLAIHGQVYCFCICLPSRSASKS